jgi:hypothetical protein
VFSSAYAYRDKKVVGVFVRFPLPLYGNYALSDKFSVFNAGATSRHENYDRQGVTSTDQEVFNIQTL